MAVGITNESSSTNHQTLHMQYEQVNFLIPGEPDFEFLSPLEVLSELGVPWKEVTDGR